jgi:hypothetical protein
LFYHLGGNGPWIPKADGLKHPDVPLPKHCMVDQVHMVSGTFTLVDVVRYIEQNIVVASCRAVSHKECRRS